MSANDSRVLTVDQLIRQRVGHRRRTRIAAAVVAVLLLAGGTTLVVHRTRRQAADRARIGLESPARTGPAGGIIRIGAGGYGDGPFPGPGAVPVRVRGDDLDPTTGFHWTIDRRLAMVWFPDCEHDPSALEQTGARTVTVLTVYQPQARAHGTHVGCLGKLPDTFVFALPGTITAGAPLTVHILSQTFTLPALSGV